MRSKLAPLPGPRRSRQEQGDRLRIDAFSDPEQGPEVDGGAFDRLREGQPEKPVAAQKRPPRERREQAIVRIEAAPVPTLGALKDNLQQIAPGWA